MKKNIVYLLIGLLTFYSCRPVQNTTSAYNTFDVQYLGEEGYGKLVLKVFASGNSQKECIENAKLSALREVLFKGVNRANDSRPLIGGANPEEKYKSFFNDFFSDQSSINSIVALNSNGNIDKNDRMRVKSNTGRRTQSSYRAKKLNIGVELIVDKNSLVQMLQSSKIITN
jgi:hypothetical protein